MESYSTAFMECVSVFGCALSMFCHVLSSEEVPTLFKTDRGRPCSWVRVHVFGT